MTVGELIEQLKDLKQDKEIGIMDDKTLKIKENFEIYEYSKEYSVEITH